MSRLMPQDMCKTNRITTQTNNIKIDLTKDQQQKSVQFQASNNSWTYEVPHSRDSTFGASDTTDRIDDFMSRPVLIQSLTWTPSLALSFEFNPWTNYFEDARVLARISNFRNLRCDMQLKFLINGNPFYYGRAIASYIPIPTVDERSVRTTEARYFIQKSQRPHIYINPTDSTGGDLILPYFYPKDALSVVDKEWRRMGIVAVEDIVQLLHANGNTDSINITIFAMPCNLQLSVPTSKIPINEASDEYARPSSIAHSLANASAQLANVPLIGPYMRATSMVVSQIGELAAVFGYSRPREVRESMSIRNRPVSNLASTNVPDNIAPLSLDSKKEVTIDPRVVGLPGVDEMALLPIAMRESFLCTVPWSVANGIGTHLRSVRVTPIQGDVQGTNYILTPSAFVTLPFRYWKGTMRLRIAVVASAYHRGRLKIVWDPEFNSSADATTYNTNYIQIIDISQNHETVMDIGWGATTSYLQTGGLDFPSFSSTEYTTRNPFTNGTVSIYVLNELTTPGDVSVAAPATIVLHTSFLEDFEVAAPDSSVFEAGIAIAKVAPINVPLPVPPLGPTTPPMPPPTNISPVTFNGLPIGTYTPGFITTLSAFAVNTTTLQSNSLGPVAHIDYAISNAPTGSTAAITMQVNFASGSHNLRVESLNTNTGLVIDTRNFTVASGLQNLAFTITAQTGNGRNRLRFTNTTNSDTYQLVKWAVQGVKYIAMPTYGLTTPVGGTATVTSGIWDVTSASSTSYARIPLPTPTTGDCMVHISSYATVGVTVNMHMEYNDGTVSILTGQMQIPTGTIPNQYSTPNGTFFPNQPGKIGVALRISSINASPVSWKMGPILYSTPTIVNQAEDTGDAPVALSSDVQVAPSTYGSLANHVYFGEQATSWRQLLKRYVECAFFTGSNITQVLNETTGDTGQYFGALVLNRLHPMDYARSAYVGYRGGWRLRVLINPNTSGAYTGRAFLYRPNVQELTSSAFNVYPKWDGTTFDPINLSGTTDAEIPYYSQFRFLPARSGNQAYVPPATGIDTGIQRLPVALSINSSLSLDVSCCKAIAEDFSLHFFLSAPVLTLSA